jgi:hypothetical protein
MHPTFQPPFPGFPGASDVPFSVSLFCFQELEDVKKDLGLDFGYVRWYLISALVIHLVAARSSILHGLVNIEPVKRHLQPRPL